MNQTIRFILGFHYHIPASAGDRAHEEAYDRALKPFISTLYQYPKIQAALHYSGVLLHWLERAHPEFFMLLGDLVSRKQVELLGGGFYEPLLPLLPLSDRIGQIELLTTYLRKQFGKRPQGCMLPLMAWEPQLASPLNACGMKYTFLGEDQFRNGSGSGDPPVPSITEDQGKLVTVFPVLSRLGKDFACRRASDVLSSLLESETRGLVCVFPERFFPYQSEAESPEYRFHRFFEDLSAFESRIEFIQPGKAFKTGRFLPKTYFSCSLQTDSLPEGSRNSLPRGLLLESPEANGIYAKMLFTHVLINQFRGDKSRKRTAREELWKAQGCDSFCSAGDPEIYRHGVRKAAYRALLEAEKLIRDPGNFTPSLLHFDFDLDGEGEYLFQGDAINCYIQAEGAGVFEFDYLPRSWNYLDAFDAAGKRTAFSDYLVPPDADIQGVPGDFSGRGRRCGTEKFDLARIDKERTKVTFRLPPKPGAPYGNVEIEKTYQLKNDALTVSYLLRSCGNQPQTFLFIPSIDLSFPGEGASFLRFLEQSPGVFAVQDLKNETLITLTSNRTFNVKVNPVYLYAGAETQDEPGQFFFPQFFSFKFSSSKFSSSKTSFSQENSAVYQSTCIMPIQPVSLDPRGEFETEFRLQIQPFQ
ncbi:MAG: alpha-amylase [Spirochaetaceae bacterium]|jgi:hypothetical protein|nr:alpha-amylase [Spirochaetaceae bacterium]